MNGRLIFYCLAVVALVLIFAAAPSHATERRDPVLNPDSAQAGSAHRTEVVPHAAQRSTHAKKTAHAAKTTHGQSGNSPLEAKDKTAAKKSASDGQAGSSSGTK